MEQASPLKKRRNSGGLFAGMLAFIPLLGFLIFGAFPLISSAAVSFTELHTPELGSMKFVGFRNFITVLLNRDDGRTYPAYFSTILYTLNVPVCMGISVWISVLLNRVKFGKGFFRAVFFIPYVCSTVVVTLAFRTLLFDYQSGAINTMLDKLGFEPVGWLNSSPWLFMFSAIVLSVWRGLGWCIVLYQAALSNVDKTYYEAASIDGATPGQMFRDITWPAISPTTAYILVIKIMGSLQEVEMMMMLTRGSNSYGVPMWPFTETAWVSDTVVNHIYNMIFGFPFVYGYGIASAAAWVLAIVIFIVTRLIMKSQDKWVCYDF